MGFENSNTQGAKGNNAAYQRAMLELLKKMITLLEQIAANTA